MALSESETSDVRKMLVDIQLALSSSHNTVTTDNLDAKPDDTHWRINHALQVKQVGKIAELLGINLCSDPRCIRGSSDL